MPKSRALPPVECCRGTSPNQEENSRPFRKAAPLPMAATIAVVTNGPMPGIRLSRWQAGSEEAICSTFVHRDDLLLEVFPLAPQQAGEVTHAWCEVRICVLEDLRHHLLQLEGSLGEHHATLQ